MYLKLPNRAYLADIERFLRAREDDGRKDFTFDLSQGFFSVHPLVLCMTASMAARARLNGGSVSIINDQNTASLRYLERMKLFDAIGVESVNSVREHEPAGRFISVTKISNGEELSEFITDVIPLLHAGPEESMTIRYVLAELVRNTLEHSGPPHEAYVAAQVVKSDGRLAVAVADHGIGIRNSITRFHPAVDDRAAIVKAFEPGISGATSKFGGNENNGGAGLFFMKAMATMARCHMVAVSGESAMKLRRTEVGDVAVQPSLDTDKVLWRDTGEYYPGTAIGIDIQVRPEIKFNDLLSEIRNVYGVRIKEQKKAKRKARFS
ncbi:ATP-binding protein [Nocardia harenae]|uniref:ATP-binding protein n=1 Tax=Nocardia harenae TaxID=358707 RepID=UPI000A9E3634|nr:ATP-binding protein [Nocardia harenae]